MATSSFRWRIGVAIAVCALTMAAPRPAYAQLQVMTSGGFAAPLKAALPDARNTVLFVGYQAEGTRGRQLVDGEKVVKIHGEMIPVRAEVALVESMSAHADSNEVLRWLGGFARAPRITFIVHGEPVAMDALTTSIHNRLGWATKIPDYRETVVLDDLQ